MTWMIIRTIFYIMIAASIWIAAQFHIATELKEQMYQAPKNVLFINDEINNDPKNISQLYDDRFSSIQKKLLQKFSPIERKYSGTQLFPFSSIQSALEVVENTNIRIIKIANGVYEESLILPENITLIGSGETIIYSDPLTHRYTLHTNENNHLVNLTISGGKYAVVIPYDTSVIFERVIFSNAKNYGVLMEQKERINETPDGTEIIIYEYFDKTEEELASMPLVIFNECTVKHNGKQGMYLRDGRVLIKNSHVIENGEEGIDLHPHMHAQIINTESSHNGESGFETEIYDNIITIENSVFDNNVKNGIALITSHGTGSILIKNSTITNNQKYGIRCAIHKSRPRSPRPFFQAVIKEENNIFENNTERYASECFSF
jgi:hypothetical protein